MEYEITFIGTDEKISESVKKSFELSEISLKKERELGQKQFAYPIQKNDSGYYFVFEFLTEPKNLAKLEKNLKVVKDLLRYLIVKKIRLTEVAEKRREPLKTEAVEKPEKPVPEKSPMPQAETPETGVLPPEESVEKAKTAIEEEKLIKKETKKPEKPEPKLEKEKAPTEKPRQKKPVRVTAAELDKKLEELVKED